DDGTIIGSVSEKTPPGKYGFDVTVTDSRGATATRNYTLTVLLDARVDGMMDEFQGVTGQARTLAVSVANVVAPVVYSFDWGDGTQTTGDSPTASHAYASSGTYLVRLDAT